MMEHRLCAPFDGAISARARDDGNQQVVQFTLYAGPARVHPYLEAEHPEQVIRISKAVDPKFGVSGILERLERDERFPW